MLNSNGEALRQYVNKRPKLRVGLALASLTLLDGMVTSALHNPYLEYGGLLAGAASVALVVAGSNSEPNSQTIPPHPEQP